jgi:hypothetical protein
MIGDEIVQCGFDGPPNFGGIMLNPTGLGKMLGELPVGPPNRHPMLVDSKRTDPGSSCINSDNDGHDRRVARVDVLRAIRPSEKMGECALLC